MDALHELPRWRLVDLATLAVVGFVVLRSLWRRASVLSALVSGLGALLVCWLVLVAVVAWAPGPWARAGARSELLHAVPPPHHLNPMGEIR